MLTEVQAAGYTIRGVSVGGIYTSLYVQELGVLLDVGMPLRSFAAADRIFLSHGHVDHLGALTGLLGIRGMMRKERPTVFMPAEIVDDVIVWLEVASRMQRFALEVDPIGMRPGDEHKIRSDMHVRAFRTHHPVPSLGYQFFRRVDKLKPEYYGLPGPEIGARRARGEPLFDTVEHLELAYATDTLVRVLDTNPRMLESKALVLECTFLDQQKSLADSRAGCHIHLDELLARADDFKNEAIVLMHFSQIYAPKQVHAILDARCPQALRASIVPFAPPRGGWPG